jgi:hypothetical protein
MSRAIPMPFHGVIVLALVSCQQIPNPGDPLQPVAMVAGAAVSTPAPLGGPQGDFDFDAEDRPENEVGVTIDSESSEEDLLALQARANGLDPDELTAPEPTPAPVPEVQVQVPVPVEVPVWDPTQPLSGGSWGIRLLATLHDVQPPRAVLGLPDGQEIVVQAGTFVEAHRLVVMAVGRDVVQVSRVTPQGFYAQVETETLQALFAPDASR